MPKPLKQPKKIRKAVKSVAKKEIKKDIKKMVKKPTMLGQGIRALGGAIGGLYGSSTLGARFGSTISRIIGQGDYDVMGCNDSESGPPSFAPLNAGVRITHREYITDVRSSNTFASTTFYLNPGLIQTYPWLSTVAKNFEEYEIKGMIVYLKTNSANAVSSTNTALGMWGVVTQYDATDADFTTKQQCENYTGTTTAVPSKSVLHAVECKKNANVLSRLYVRSGALQTDQDQKFYDLGKFQVFTQGAQAASTIGELWISYDIVLSKPRLPSGGLDAYTDRYFVATGATGPTSSQPLGLNTTLGSGTIGTTFVGSTNVINFPTYSPEGYYLINLRWGGITSLTNTVAPVLSVTGSISFITYFSTSPQNTGTGLLSPNVVVTVVVRKIGTTSGTVTLGVNGNLPPNPNLDAIITLIDADSVPQLMGKTKTAKLTLDDVSDIKDMLRSFKQQREVSYKDPFMSMDIEEDYENIPVPVLKRQNAYVDYDNMTMDSMSRARTPFNLKKAA